MPLPNEMMQAGGMPPGRGMPPQGAPPQDKSSILNPKDAAMKAASGKIRPDMTVGQFLEQNLGVTWNDPLTKFLQVMKGQTKNSTMQGKLGMGRPEPQGMGMAPKVPPPASAPPGAPPGMDGLMRSLGR